MSTRRLLVEFLIAMSIVNVQVSAAFAEEAQGDVEYTIANDDNLRIIAAAYYGDPKVYKHIYNKNRKVLEEAFRKNKLKSDTREFGPDILWPKTVIILPVEFQTRFITYERRQHPLRRDIAERIADRIKPADMTDVIHTVDATKLARIKVDRPTPLDGFTETAGGAKRQDAKREDTPQWYKTPATPMQQCAKAVCDAFKSLCYFECVAVSKRIFDGDSACSPLPKTLPYEFDPAISSDCSAFME